MNQNRRSLLSGLAMLPAMMVGAVVAAPKQERGVTNYRSTFHEHDWYEDWLRMQRR